jgi:hypothetical protein
MMLTLVLPFAGARAVPSFAIQTGQPCAACHVGAFGPQLTSFGRDFKLYGYISDDTKKHGIPISASDLFSFTHTQADQPPGSVSPPRFSVNNNIEPAQEASLFYAGTVIPKQVGAFVEIHYDAGDGGFSLGNVDIRRAKEGHLFGEDMVWGIDLNDVPTVQDLWNSTPGWGYPYFGPGLAPSPAGTAQIQSQDITQLGVGSYLMWNDLIYLETTLYAQPPRGYERTIGQPISGGAAGAYADRHDGVTPYWRLALQHGWDKDHQYFEIGTVGEETHIRPGGVTGLGSDSYLDNAIDASYQWYANPNEVTAPIISAHAIYVNEQQSLAASQALGAAAARDYSLNSFHADVSYAYQATFIPTVQYFTSSGSGDPLGHWGSGVNGPVSNPGSAGVTAEMAYVPWGKPDSPFGWRVNARFTVQYTDYFRFNGTSAHASDNNTLWLVAHLAFAFN